MNINFLKELQHEMLTQDKCSQAAPRYWGILETDRQYGLDEDYADDYELVDDEGNSLESAEKLCDYLSANLDNIVDALDCASAEVCFERAENGFGKVEITIRYNEEDEEGGEDEETVIESQEEAVDFMDQVNLDYDKRWYADRKRVVPGPIFLTRKAAQEYCNKFGYNHNDPHPYAMTAYRSPEIEMLWNILEKTDWNEVFSSRDYVATKLWSEDDIRAELKENDYEGTDEQVAAVINSGKLKHLEDCTDSEWEIIGRTIDTVMKERKEPRLYLSGNDASDTPVSICGPHVRVDWYNDGEGLSGDYDEDDPEDVNLLRFDVYYRTDIDDEWTEVEDASYCTRMPADTKMDILIRSAKVLYKEYCNVLESDPEQSVKKLGERLSWISPEDFADKKEVS